MLQQMYLFTDSKNLHFKALLFEFIILIPCNIFPFIANVITKIEVNNLKPVINR